mmetsp:Transcript_32530/g.49757  ORF Transcript_32530/g.49757 Transcript_32530/m.49757 type:complete len:102 (+) Transcript_32530:75-380(+)
MQKDKETKAASTGDNYADASKKQSTSEYSHYLRRKNNLETRLFKKKYERISKHISGTGRHEKQANPFTRSYKPSVFNEQIMDPKMNIPQNEELLEIFSIYK